MSSVPDRSTLVRLYHDEGKSMSDIADEYGVGTSTVNRWLKSHNIETRHRGSKAPANRDEGIDLLDDEEWLRSKLYDEIMHPDAIADEVGCSTTTVRRRMDKHDLSIIYKDENALRTAIRDRHLTPQKIADELGRSRQTIIKWANDMGIEYKPWKHEEVLQELQNNGLSTQEIGEKLGCSRETIATWMDNLGIERPRKGQSGTTYSDKELINQIQRVFDEEGKISRKEFDERKDTASVTTLDRHFGSWLEALKSAGVSFSESREKAKQTFSKEEVVSSFEKYADSVEEVTRSGFLDSKYGPSTVTKYDSFEYLIRDSDIQTEKIPSQYLNKNDVVKLTKKIDGPETMKSVSSKIGVSTNKILSLFDNSERFFDECEIERKSQGYTEEEIVSELNLVSDGKIKPSDIRESDVSRGAIINQTEHDSISDAVRDLGFEYCEKQYTDDELIAEMKRCHDEYGEVKVGILKQDETLPSWFTYVNRFGSWSRAKEVAGVESQTDRGRPNKNEEYEGHTYLYGKKFYNKADTVRQRAGLSCQVCGINQSDLDRKLDVHHIQPVRSFDKPEEAHTFDNLVALCHDCHMSVEADKIECPDPPDS